MSDSILRVGLTGGIGTGKSHALAEFGRLGAYTIDADKLAHRIIEKGQPAFDEIINQFGTDLLGPDGEIDRKKLGKTVFADEQKLSQLNAIVHPRVFEEEERELKALHFRQTRRSPIVITDAALMIETGSYKQYDKIIVVSCSPELQFARLIARDGLTPDEASLRISRQMPVTEKIKYADYLIENSGKYSDTQRQIKQVYVSLLADFEQMRASGEE
ncbi:MAG TPA: dephospho-CoA kinase [Acidobacteriota bacterium]|jgi:dephospho-CoA kinase|nr:dephospho-CoA kinase [Acidobacteriota bacterium]